MTKALIALPSGIPLQELAPVLAISGVSPRLFIDGLGGIIDVPMEQIGALAGLPNVAAVTTEAIPDPGALPVSAEAQPWLQAWNMLVDSSFQEAVATRSAQWLDTVSAKLCVPAGDASAFDNVPGMTLTGTIALGIVIVDGPFGTTAKLSPRDHSDIGLNVIQALEILYRNAPASAHLVFVAETRTVNLAIPPSPVANSDDYEALEAPWRDPALNALGFASGIQGVGQYRTQLQARPWFGDPAERSIVAFFTNYNTAHFAYAFTPFGRLVVQVNNTRINVLPIDMDRVIAHEMCHLFNAQDEYANERSSCRPFDTSGPFNAPNGNCVHANIPGLPHQPCLMSGESDDMCMWTKAHVGWNPLPFPLPPIF